MKRLRLLIGVVFDYLSERLQTDYLTQVFPVPNLIDELGQEYLSDLFERIPYLSQVTAQ